MSKYDELDCSSSMWIKICGNTNLEDAQMASALGVDAVGFVFVPGARQVNAAQVARITPHLSGVEKVGVFPALDAAEIVAAVEESGLDAVQLHGGVSLALLRELQESFEGTVKLIQVVHWVMEDASANADVLARQLRGIAEGGNAERVLVDSKVGAALGGTGVTFDWEASRGVLAEAATGLKLIVAGGLRAENVGDAIRKLEPWGVDVASGVELSPGRKDPEKVANFIRRAREASEKR
jgi:phosphoribosylanthranilate isomerase